MEYFLLMKYYILPLDDNNGSKMNLLWLMSQRTTIQAKSNGQLLIHYNEIK